MRKFILTLALLASTGTAHAIADTVFVTPTNLQGWVSDDTRAPGTAAITPVHPQSGNGSFEFITTGANDKANASLYWTPGSTANPFGVVTTIGNLSTLTYDWFRSSASTSVSLEMPALRFYFINADGKFGSLVYELAYNGVNGSIDAPTDSWQTADLSSAQMWMRSNVNLNAADQTMTIAQWINPSLTKPTGAYAIDASTSIIGVSASVGSGIGGLYDGGIDNVQVGFAGGATNTYNFEVSAVPEPSSFALGGLGLFGVGALVYRRRQVAA